MSKLEQFQPGEIREKVVKTWGDRRKFLTRGFIGSAGILLGTAFASQGLTGLVVNQGERIVEETELLDNLPGQEDISTDALSSRIPGIVFQNQEDHTENKKAAQTVALGSTIVGLGAVIASGEPEKITRRALFSRAKYGAIAGVTYHILDVPGPQAPYI